MSDILDEVIAAVQTDTYRRLSPLETLRLTILEQLLARERRAGSWSIARGLHMRLEDSRRTINSTYVTVINDILHELANLGYIEMDQVHTKIRRVSITVKGRDRLRQLLELERSDYPAFLREMRHM